MLAHLLDDLPISLETMSTRLQVSELLALVQAQGFSVVCLADLPVPPSPPSKTRYLVKRLRATLPDVRILVGRWGPAALADESAQLLRHDRGNARGLDAAGNPDVKLQALVQLLGHGLRLAQGRGEAQRPAAVRD